MWLQTQCELVRRSEITQESRHEFADESGTKSITDKIPFSNLDYYMRGSLA